MQPGRTHSRGNNPRALGGRVGHTKTGATQGQSHSGVNSLLAPVVHVGHIHCSVQRVICRSLVRSPQASTLRVPEERAVHEAGYVSTMHRLYENN